MVINQNEENYTFVGRLFLINLQLQTGISFFICYLANKELKDKKSLAVMSGELGSSLIRSKSLLRLCALRTN